MKKIALAVVMGSIAVSASAVTWSNGNLVTNSLSDRDLTAITADNRGSTFGLNVNANGNPPGPFSVADDFTVGSSPILVSQVMVYGYHLNDAADASIDQAFLRIWAGTPDSNSPTLVYGDFVNNRRTSTAFAVSSNGRAIYRTANGTSTNTQRRIQQVNIGLGGGVALEANTQYFFEWGLGRSQGANGADLSVAPLALSNTTGAPNGLVHFELGEPVDGTLEGSSNWGSAALNNGSLNGVAASKVDLPFGLEYQAVPEPGTMIAVGAGLVALAARRRRKA